MKKPSREPADNEAIQRTAQSIPLTFLVKRQHLEIIGSETYKTILRLKSPSITDSELDEIEDAIKNCPSDKDLLVYIAQRNPNILNPLLKLDPRKKLDNYCQILQQLTPSEKTQLKNVDDMIETGEDLVKVLSHFLDNPLLHHQIFDALKHKTPVPTFTDLQNLAQVLSPEQLKIIIPSATVPNLCQVLDQLPTNSAQRQLILPEMLKQMTKLNPSAEHKATFLSKLSEEETTLLAPDLLRCRLRNKTAKFNALKVEKGDAKMDEFLKEMSEKIDNVSSHEEYKHVEAELSRNLLAADSEEMREIKGEIQRLQGWGARSKIQKIQKVVANIDLIDYGTAISAHPKVCAELSRGRKTSLPGRSSHGRSITEKFRAQIKAISALERTGVESEKLAKK